MFDWRISPDGYTAAILSQTLGLFLTNMQDTSQFISIGRYSNVGEFSGDGARLVVVDDRAGLSVYDLRTNEADPVIANENSVLTAASLLRNSSGYITATPSLPL